MSLIKKTFFREEIQRHKEKARSFILPGLLVLFFAVFTDKTTAIINSLLVQPLLSSFKSSSIFRDIIWLSIACLIIFYFIWKAILQIRMSVLLEAYILLGSTLYFSPQNQCFGVYIYSKTAFDCASIVTFLGIFATFGISVCCSCLLQANVTFFRKFVTWKKPTPI